MIHIIIGMLSMAGFLLIVNYTKNNHLQVRWWQWVVTVMGFFYAIFVLEAVVSFLKEGIPRGALVMGVLMGFIAVIWGVLLARFVFSRKIA